MLAPFSRLYFQRATCIRGKPRCQMRGRGSRPPRSVLPAFRSAVLPGGGTGHPLHEVHPGVLELRPDEAEAEEENPEVVLGACRVVGALVFGGGAGRGLGFRRDCEAKLNVRLDLSSVGRAIEGPDLDRSGSE